MSDMQLTTGQNNRMPDAVFNHPLKTAVTSDAFIKNSQSNQLFNLLPGQVFRGQVTDIRNGFATIQINQQTIQAKLDQAVEINMNETICFMVKENENNRLIITPYKEQNLSSEDTALYKALNAVDLPATDKNIDVVSELLKNQMPIDKKTIQNLLSLSFRYQNAKLSDLVKMVKYHIEVNEANLAQFEKYNKYEHQLTNDIKQFLQTIPETLHDVLTTMGKEETTRLLKDMINQNTISQPILKEVLQQLDSSDADTSRLQELILSKEFREALKDELTDAWTIKPQKLGSNEIDDTYNKMQNQLQMLTEHIQDKSKQMEKTMDTVKNMQDNIQFMKNVNDNFIYMQLPLNLRNQITHSDLYVYKNKKTNYNLNEGIRLLLHLDMEYLGNMDILIFMKASSVNLDFTLMDEEAVHLLQSNLEELKNNLSKKGYLVQAQVNYNSKEEPIHFVEDFLEQGTNKTDYVRYSFDMRA
jgi:Flagellar hook-length control protein FliK.